MDIKLVMLKAEGDRHDFPLTKAKTIIGRKGDADLRIPLSSVSREHCVIEINDGGEARLRDLGSSNGTMHNDERIQEVVLQAGDRISIGPVHLTVVIDGEPEEIQAVPTVLPSDGTQVTAAEPAIDPSIPLRPVADAPAVADAAPALSPEEEELLAEDDDFDVSFDDGDDEEDDDLEEMDFEFEDDDEDDRHR